MNLVQATWLSCRTVKGPGEVGLNLATGHQLACCQFGVGFVTLLGIFASPINDRREIVGRKRDEIQENAEFIFDWLLHQRSVWPESPINGAFRFCSP